MGYEMVLTRGDCWLEDGYSKTREAAFKNPTLKEAASKE